MALPPRRASDQHYGWLLQPPTADVSDYDEVAALTEYVWRHYAHLLTASEARAGIYRQPLDRDAATRAKGPEFADWLDRTYGPVDMPELQRELAGGRAVLYLRARDRILREHQADVFINRCPACSRIVRSPVARQCLWCKHDWHRGVGG